MVIYEDSSQKLFKKGFKRLTSKERRKILNYVDTLLRNEALTVRARLKNKND